MNQTEIDNQNESTEDTSFYDAVDETATQETEVSNEAEEQEVDSTKQVTQAAPTPTSVKLDDDSIAAIKAATRYAEQQVPQTQQKQLTPEEFDKLTKRTKITPETLKRMGFAEPTDELAGAYQEFYDQSAQHAFAKSAIYFQGIIEQLQEKLEQRISPLQTYYQQQYQQQVERTFFDKYAHLQPYKDVVTTVARGMANSLPAGTTEEQAMQLVAAQTINILQKAGVSVNQQSTQKTANHSATAGQGNQAVTAMNAMHTGGRSQSPTGTKKNWDADIY